MTASEYIFRKPDTHIFDLAIRKSGLDPANMWYCGNDIEIDMVGTYQAGLYPVLYEDRSVPSKIHEKNDRIQADFPYLIIDNWQKLIDII